MPTTVRKSLTTIAAIGALGLGGSAIADAAGTGSSSSRSSSAATTTQHRPAREALSSDVAAKVKAAALEELPGATVLRTEAGGPYATKYHAHVRTADGTLKVVLVDASFDATGVQADTGRRGGPRGGGHHGAETALTGDTKAKVEAAVLARYAGATIVRTETNADGGAPYESHITTSAGKELEVLVGADFEVVGATERPARP